MNVEWELEDLEKAFSKYGFDTERWLIPSRRSHLKLNNKVSSLAEKYNDQEPLVIIYYAGQDIRIMHDERLRLSKYSLSVVTIFPHSELLVAR